MNKIFFIADNFFYDGFYGGAERCDDCLLEEFLHDAYNNFRESVVFTINSVNVSPEFLEKNRRSLYFVSNFMLLSEESKKYFVDNQMKYIIIEHDHKYLKSNNPALYSNFLSNEEGLQNQDFYHNAKAVICQSTLHAQTVYKNLLLNNIVNLKGNLWTDLDLSILEEERRRAEGQEKNSKWSILNSSNRNKGTPATIKYCLDNNLDYSYLPDTHIYLQFIRSLSQSSGVVFFPYWMESFNRFLVEARALECKVKTSSKKVGCTSDGFLQFKGEALIAKLRASKTNIFKIYNDLILGNPVEFYKQELPRVSIITTFVEAEEYVHDYLESIVNQTIFDEIDLMIYDAGSTGQEQDIIKKYTKKYNNIIYFRDEKKIGSSAAFNKLIKKSKNEFISMVMMDDRPAPDYAEKLRKHLNFAKVDLAYGDCVVTTTKNAKITKDFDTTTRLYEHSLADFSPENMIKSLPGPMPMFKKSMIETNGGFDKKYKHANDWELWLRCVRGGSIFYKVHSRVGLYYFNPDGVTTSKHLFNSKIKEECVLFNEYRDVIGDDNYHKYKSYFNEDHESREEDPAPACFTPGLEKESLPRIPPVEVEAGWGKNK